MAVSMVATANSKSSCEGKNYICAPFGAEADVNEALLVRACSSEDNELVVLTVSTDALGGALDVELPAPLGDELDVE